MTKDNKNMINFEINKEYKLNNATNNNHRVKVISIADKSIKMFNYWLNTKTTYKLSSNYKKNSQVIQNKSKGITVWAFNII
jgi:hypothetical protein